MKVFVSEYSEWTHSTSVNKDLGDKKIEYTSIWIKHNPIGLKIFYCHQCRYPVFQYEGDVVTILPGSVPSRVPILCQCKGKACGHKYYIHVMTD